MVSGFGFRVSWFRVSGFGFRVSGSLFRVSGSGLPEERTDLKGQYFVAELGKPLVGRKGLGLVVWEGMIDLKQDGLETLVRRVVSFLWFCDADATKWFRHLRSVFRVQSFGEAQEHAQHRRARCLGRRRLRR
jgi:hypothetical protein